MNCQQCKSDSSYRCFSSGQAQKLAMRPVLKGSVTAFGQFPVENSWVNQVTGVEGVDRYRKGACSPPVLAYQCSQNKVCRHYALPAGKIEPVGQVGGSFEGFCACGGGAMNTETGSCSCGQKVNWSDYWKTDGRTLNYPQVNSCSTTVGYRQRLDQRRGPFDCGNC